MRNSVLAIVVAVLALNVPCDSGAQPPAAGGPAKSAAKSPAGSAPASGAPPAVPASSRIGMGALLDQFTTLEDRDISVLVTSGDETTLSSQMAGKIRKVNYGLGDNVAAHAVILEFDCEEQVAQLQSAEAEYRGARETHLTKLRLQALGAAGELEVTVAASAADKARSQVALRESQIAYCKVVAPFTGRLVKMKVKLAESVSLGQPLLDMVNPGSLKAQLYVPAAWLGWIRAGSQFTVKTSQDGRTYRARVTKLNARVEGVSQSLELEARFEGSTQGLLPGMVGTAVFPDRPKP
ncbi:MAG: HlyD family efflux transporter periplasmic adaptor subunit [Proteobacteria bacterium]|nr:HlyD family efflux transporter periplasmic adaptor subunit [Pseudomonadota bacterium]